MDTNMTTTGNTNDPMILGKIFAESGMFPTVKTQAQAAVKIMAGKEIGLSPFEAMKNVYMVNGTLALQSNAMASLVKKSSKYDYKLEKLDDTECIITFLRDKEKLGDSVYTFKDAAKAGLVNKDNWKNHPRNMLFARALSNGVRWFCPDVACGWYTKEEMDDTFPIQTVNNNAVIEITSSGEVKNGET